MNEAYEVELNNITASFMPTTFDLVLGVEIQSTLQVDESDMLHAFTDMEWQVMYARVLVDDRWFFLPQTLYDEVDDEFGDQIGDLLWKLTAKQ